MLVNVNVYAWFRWEIEYPKLTITEQDWRASYLTNYNREIRTKLIDFQRNNILLF